MRNIAVIARKGGSGKSTVAIHLALAHDFELKEEFITLPPGATARRTIGIKSP